MEFLNTAFTFPTVIFSTLLIIVLLFWLIALLGLADLDMLEGDVDIEAESASSSSYWELAFGGVPLSISLSIIISLGWIISLYVQQFFAYLLGDGFFYYLTGTAFMIASLIAALPLTALLVRPLRRFFESQETTSKHALIGLECTIATSRVSHSFGQARVYIQGTEQLIEVRSDEDNTFTLGDSALLIEHDESTHSYTIVAKPW
ncbi:OB-fold-containig protein [Pseudoalteromonas piscicida]|uniref:DUF1449 domain-containing protein n=1 Tax=Pseudoalteromonas piscicida TaxID=43662 RepID=A0A2A5JRG5_PSEO7|nr:OB-fold-containig protein [Pseudoalteromonas piscicida]PCK31990.1 DUF1449 domain-containing protein [Pseudoalteromonas piscicida]